MRFTCMAAVSLFLFLITSHAATADIKRHKAVPEVFWGEWIAAGQSCIKNDQPPLSITASTYTRADTRCTIDWVGETAGRAGAIYSAHMRCSTGEQPQPSIANLILVSGENGMVSLGSDFKSLQSYQRCPAE
ncbi:hypothetical protein [Methylobacterium oxalidis]|uniref:DUF3617 family protein n=1 Tax=Methylobacterium oxalidis TaxID=944322 RepID=A0A512J0C7_9HYPH|nr:hypothetical protein [Methylobacterium oxalidis]GEP03418.1 hypothetical protein MOX02_14560 [Methylobacterium oxalidis]GJE30215.1 hypothetical protein LDDCCGHA_0378 [Methylobacterium oxalidis]GLS63377.1 hypothetical protein GCM10007888_17580 [Methylobacterium oxalidis]